MKFIHCADLHLDSKMEALSSEKSKYRREECVRTFERLCSYATENGVCAVIIAGDMFDTGRVSAKVRDRVISAIKQNSTVDFLYLSGNHDEDNFISQLEDVPDNLKIFSDEWTEFSYGDVLISGVRFTNTNKSTIYDTLSLPLCKFNIVVLHGQVAGYKSNESAEVISIPRLKDKNIDYLALGHIHSYSTSEIDQRGKFAYSGCLEGRGFDETGEKGFVLINVNDKKADYNFIKFASRSLIEHEFDVSNFATYIDAREELLSEITEKYDSSCMLKLVLNGEITPEFNLDEKGLVYLLNEKFFFAKVKDKTRLKINIEDYAHDKSIRGEFVRAVFDSEISDDEKNKILACGLAVLRGDDL